LEYLGRLDEQVKLRGHRIELGEIEAVLQDMEGIEQAVVILREKQGEKRLIGYVVKKDGKIGPTEIRRLAAERLPDYMVPSAIVEMDRLPLTPNGKIDRKALPDPGSARPDLNEAYVEPETEAQKMLAEIWKQVLGVDRVGIHDNFFSLGGDSIRTLQVVSRARNNGLAFSLQDLYRRQTISELASQITVAEAQPQPPETQESEVDVEQLLAELESMSDEDVRARLNAEGVGL
jgi:non-ribosomal peptide synthetase component F